MRMATIVALRLTRSGSMNQQLMEIPNQLRKKRMVLLHAFTAVVYYDNLDYVLIKEVM